MHQQPNGVTFNVPGEYELDQYADYTNKVDEYNESNNWLVVFEFLNWLIELFSKDGEPEVKYRIIVVDPEESNPAKTAHYEELIRTGRFVTFH